MLVIPEIKIQDGKNLILSIGKLSLTDGDSVYLHSDSPRGKTIFLHTLYWYLQKDKRTRDKFIKKGETIFFALCQKKSKPRRSNRNVLLIEHDPVIIPNLTLNRNITLPFQSLNIRLKNKILEYLQLFNLNNKQFLPASCLSFTEMKIVELIRAVMLLPEVIMIDDFDTSFHQTYHDQVHEILDLMQKNGTILIATGKSMNNSFSVQCTINDKVVIKL